MIEHKSNKIYILLFIILFNILWLVRVFFVPKPQSEELRFVFTVTLKFLVFVLFPCLYIKFCYKESPLKLLKLNTNTGKGILYGGIVSLGIMLLGASVYLFSGGERHLVGMNIEDLFIAFVFAGFMEEVIFRGLILSKLSQLMGKKKANFLTSLLFAFIHIPQSLASGTLFTPAVLSSLFLIFIWGMIYGVIISKSNSLWATVIPHGIWDCAVHMLG